MRAAITVENLSKRYVLGALRHNGYRTLRETVMAALASPWRRLREAAGGNGKSGPAWIWALKDVNLEIQPGEVVGIIGRNGAGKSTLLKVLSRITEPTSGRVVLRGHIGSLLEVGTGFHPELTGRENIFLNGAILGMSRREIARKFDEIVAFSEVEQFLDTPVKRYSSGMFVRLAFAVAAHLEPEILVVDEVLAVGDHTFQRKCLSKMNSISRSGCTVLFVSHNMATIQNLCTQVVVFERGVPTYTGTAANGIQHYLKASAAVDGGEVDLSGHPNRAPGSIPVLRRLRLLDQNGQSTDRFACGEPLSIELLVDRGKPTCQLNFLVGVEDSHGARLFTVATHLSECGPLTLNGPQRVVCHLNHLPLAPGRYCLSLVSGPPQTGIIDTVDQAASFDVVEGDYYNNGRAPDSSKGTFLMRSRWDVVA